MKPPSPSLLVLVLATFLLGSTPLRSAERHVWGDSPSPQPPFGSWATAAHDLQTAVDAAADGDTVWVTNGVYASGGAAAPGQTVLNRVVVAPGITLLSVNGPETTEILGSGPTGPGAVRGVYLAQGAALHGFTVRDGSTLASGLAVDQRGGGVYLEGQGTVSNCIIRANHAATRAGGLYAAADGGRILHTTVAGNEASEYAGVYMVNGGEVAHCTIVSNTAAGNGGGVVFWNHGTLSDSLIAVNTAWDDDGGVSFRNPGTGSVKRCEIVGNYALNSAGGVHLRAGQVLAESTVRDNVGDWEVGGGVFCQQGGTVTNCIILGNTAGYGGGVRLEKGGRVDRTVIRDNYAWYAGGAVHCEQGGVLAGCHLFNNWSRELGGGVVLSYGGVIEGCAILNNHAEFQGGAILFYGPKGIVRQCTLTGNSAGRSGAAWQGANAEVTVINSIAWDHVGLEPFNGAVGTNRFNCLENWTGGGEGILSVDPKLTQGYRLAPNSPCRGAGLAGVSAGTDIDGEAWASPPSVGCDEPAAGVATGSMHVQFVAPQADYRTVRVAAGYACEFAALVTGRADRIEWDFGDGATAADGIKVRHAWEAPGDYPVVLTAFNADHPAGVSVTNVVNVEAPGVCYVDAAGQNPEPPYATWATAATNLQDAIDACILGGTVLVTNGTYRGGPYEKAENRALRSRIVITRDLTVRSVNGPAETAIVGAGDWNGSRLVSGPHAVRCVFMNTGTLSGFTLADGHTLTNGTYSGTWEYDQSGGGAFAFGGVLTNCIVKRCSAHVWAGGVIGGTLLNCTIEGNYGASTAGGAMFATLHNCVVTNNVSREWGGGVHECQVSDSLLVNNRCGAVGQGGAGGGAGNSTLVRTELRGNSANWGGGLSHGTAIDCTFLTNAAAYGGGANVAQLNRCVLRGNSATGNGGGANEGALDHCLLEGNTSVGYGGGAAFATVLNSIIRSNAATGGRQVGVGGGLLVGSGRPARNCLILGNQAWGSGGVRFWDHTPVQHCTIVSNSFDYGAVSGPYAGTLENSIVWGQADAVTAITTNRYNCLQGSAAGGEGNLNYDPGFLDPAAGDFRLRADSPLIGAGMNLDWTDNAIDLAGSPRRIGERPDLGAYEVGALTVFFTADRTQGIRGLTNITFTASVTGTNVTGLTYRWDLDGDGAPEVEGVGLAQAVHTYPAPGAWEVSLEVRNAAGETARATLSGGIRVYPPVEADFASTQRRWSVPVTVQFTDQSRHEPQSWAWDFNGDGVIDSTERNPSWYYTNTGNYTVSLTVSNHFGAGGHSVSTITRTNYVQLPDTVQVVWYEADPPRGPVGQPVRFINQTTNLHGTVRYAWDFNNDGVIDSREENPVWTFDSTGFQSVWLTVSDDTGENTLARTQGVRIYRPLYVNPASSNPTAPYDSWATAARTIQTAITAAAPADVIWVTNGVYASGSVRAGSTTDNNATASSCLSRVALTHAVRVESVNGPASTRIVGAPSADLGGFSSNSVRCAYLAAGAELVGFTLTNGFAGGSGPWGDTSGNGGGAFLDRGGMISNCVVVACAAIGDESSRGGGDGGGGVFLNQGGAVRYSTIVSNRTDYGDGGGVHANLGGTIEFCEIRANTAGSEDEECSGGGVFLKGEGAAIRDCLVEGNTANEFGGGIGLYWAGAAVERCRVYRNHAPYGGGLGALYGGQPAHRVANCDIAFNLASEWGGGLASQSSRLTLDGCWIHENISGSSGGGLAGDGGTLNVANCTIERNEAVNSAGGVTAGTCVNCIVQNNRLTGSNPTRGTENYVASAVVLRNSCTRPLPGSGAGDGNFSDDPQLAGPDGPHLLPASPCIDRGMIWTNLLALDMDGEPRVWPVGGSLDVGCDEFVPGGPAGPLAAILLTSLINAVMGAPLDFRAEFAGWPGGLEWRFQQPDGSTVVVTNTKDAQHRWTAPGDYQVTLWATNRTGEASSTVTVRVVEAYTNYVSLAGSHLAPFDSWATAATNLQAAVDAMDHAGGTIVVDDGPLPIPTEVRVARPLVLVGRTGRDSTTLIGVPREVVTEELDPDTWELITVTNLVSNRLLFVDHAEVTLRGLTFTSGQAHGYQPHGGAVWLEGPGRILDCAFFGNQAAEWGGAVYIDGGTVSHCVFAGNRASSGGGLAAVNGARVLESRFATNNAGQRGGGVLLATGAELHSSELTGNQALYGGGVAGLDGGPVRSCEIRGNTAGQAYEQGFEWEEYLVGGEGGGAHGARLEDCELANNTTVHGGGCFGGSAYRCIIRDNVATGNGGGVRADGLTVIENCALLGNLAGGSGGGLWLPAGGAARHVTVFENSAGDLGAGVFAEADAAIQNSISAHNQGPAQRNASGGTWSHSCADPAPPGEGNFADDPRLAGPSDFHLLANSPCVDRGALLELTADLDGESRPWPEGGAPDVGCDEVKFGALDGPLAVAIGGSITQVVAGTTLDFGADLQGRVLGSLWSIQTNGGVIRLSDACAARAAWPAPGDYLVTLVASNQAVTVSTSITVRVLAAFTNYVSLAGRHIPPFLTWEDAATNVQAAVDAAVAGGTVLIGDGRYVGATEVKIDKPLTVRGAKGRDAVTIDATGNGSGRLSWADVPDPHALVSTLLTRGDPVSAFLLGQLAPTAGRGLARMLMYGYMTLEDQRLVLEGLNAILAGNSIYDEQRFAGVALSAETQTLLALNPDGALRLRLNRLLLNDAFPSLVGAIRGGSRCFSLWHPAARLEGLTLARGRAWGDEPSAPLLITGRPQLINLSALVQRHAERGGAVFLAAGGTVRDCRLVENEAKSGGGVSFNGAGTVEDCEFVGNQGGGAYGFHGGEVLRSTFTGNSAGIDGIDVRVRDCAVVGNPGRGAGIQGLAGLVTGSTFASNHLGILVTGGTRLSDSLVQGNTGGGVRCQTGSVVSNCIVRANAPWGLDLVGGAATDCRIEANESTNANGAGVLLRAAGAMLERSVVRANRTARSGAGVFCEATGTVRNCQLLDNEAGDRAGGLWLGPGAVIENSALLGNRALGAGGGLYGLTNSVARNCTVAGNTATQHGGGIFLEPGGAARNSIIQFNDAYAGANCGGGVFPNNMIPPGAFEYCCASPAPPGPGNLAADPGLLGLRNPHLASSSPCIGIGHNRYANGVDLDGDARVLPASGRVDIGCDEWTGTESGPLAAALTATSDRAVAGTPLEFRAALDGRAQGFAWIVETPEGVEILPAVTSLHRSWAQPGSYAVTLRATNTAGAVSFTTNILIAADSLAFVSPTGTHTPPFESWLTAATNVQAAVGAAWPGGTVWIDDGIILEPAEVVVDKALTVRGRHGRDLTRIDGGGAHRVFRLAHAQAVLRALTIANGLSDRGGGVRVDRAGQIVDCAITDNRGIEGAGLYLDGGGLLSGSQVRDNVALTNAGGVFLRYAGQLVDSEIEGNRAGDTGGGVCLQDGGRLTRCILAGNAATNRAGGAYLLRGGTCESSRISANTAARRGGGLFLDGAGVLTHSIVSSNVTLLPYDESNSAATGTHGGAGVYLTGTAQLDNCLLVGNASAHRGGGAFLHAGGLMINCTLTANSAARFGGGMAGGRPRSVFNCIIKANTAGYGWQDNFEENGDALVHCITGHSRFFAPGNNCIDADPQFVDPAGGDIRFKPTSPALNAGTNELTSTMTDYVDGQWITRTNVVGSVGDVDLDGHIRITREVVDIGAYEFQFEPVAFTLANALLVWPGTHEITWIQNDPETPVDLEAWSEGRVFMIASGLVHATSHSWNTTTMPDGFCDLRIRARSAAGDVLGEDRRSVFINNALAWHSGGLTESTAWGSEAVHFVTDELWIGPGVTLTLAPGAIVKFGPGARMRVLEGGALRAPATLQAPVILTSFADDTVGGDSNLDGSATVPRPGAWAGISGEGGIVDLTEAVDLRYTQSTTGGTLEASESWLGSQVHTITEDLVIPSGVTLTINPGAVVKLADKCSILVQDGGRLHAAGSTAQPIVFTSDKDDTAGGDTNGDGDQSAPAAGDWQSVFADGGTVMLDHATLAYGAGTPDGQWDQTGVLRTRGAARVTVLNSTLRDAFFEGLSIWGSAHVAVTNTVIANCDRGAMVDAGATLQLVHCTLAGNRIGIWGHRGATELVNCIVSHSLEAGIDCVLATPLTVSYTDVWSPTAQNYVRTTDLTGQNGNVSRDPKFRAAETGGYQLDYLSPCIDAADGRRSPELDAHGLARFDDPRTPNRGLPDLGGKFPDMGAHEFAETAGSDVDLVVTSVQGPARVVAGETVTVTWTLRNAGTRAVTGSWHDAVSLLDDHAPADSALLGEQEFVAQGQLGPGQEWTVTRSYRVPGATESAYAWRVHTNRRGEVFEGSNATNNVGLSLGPVSLAVPELRLGETNRGTFTAAGRSLLYKFRPPAGRTVGASIRHEYSPGGNLWQGGVQMLAAFGRAPTFGDYDAEYLDWQASSSLLAIDQARDGWYYLSLIPRLLPAPPKPFALNVGLLEDVTVTEVKPPAGGDSGEVTVALRGQGFQRPMTVSLNGPGGRLPAKALYYQNSTRAFATFDLRGQPLGPRDVEVGFGLTRRALPGAFTVEPGRPLAFETKFLAPEWVRPGRRYSVTLVYRNAGNVDLLAPFLVLRCPAGILVGGKVSWVGVTALSATSPDGPPGILRPGAENRIMMSGRGGFGWDDNEWRCEYYLHENPQPVDWTPIEVALRGLLVSESRQRAFDSLRENCPTAGDFVATLASNQNRGGIGSGGWQSLRKALRLTLVDMADDLDCSIEGHVFLGSEANPLSGAQAVAVGLDTTNRYYAASRYDGRIRFYNAQPGTYQIEFADLLPPADPATVRLAEQQLAGLKWVLPEGGAIRGRLVYPADLIPPENAVVWAATPLENLRRQVVGADGEFTLAHLPDGEYRVWHSSSLVPLTEVGGLLVTNAGTAYANLVCLAGGTLTGRLSDAASGQPLAGLSVVVTTARSRTGLSDTNGVYSITGLEPGTHTVAVHRRSWFAPAASNIVVTTARTTILDFPLHRTAALAGTVTDARTHQPLGNVTLTVHAAGQGLAGGAVTDAAGRWALTNLADGTVWLTATAARYAPVTNTVTLVEGQTTEHPIALEPAAAIFGTLTNAANGQPVAGVIVRAVCEDGTTQWAATDQAGQYCLGPLPPGKVATFLSGGSHRRGFEFNGDATAYQSDFGLVLGAIEGRVMDATGTRPLPLATIHLRCDGETVLESSADIEGRFQFPYVAPGLYAVSAVALDRTFPVLSNVAVTAGQTHALPDLLSGGLSLQVNVQPQTGDPPTNGVVLLSEPNPYGLGSRGWWGSVDTVGRAFLTNLAPGTYQISDLAVGLAPDITSVDLPQPDNRLDWTLRPGASLTGLVRHAATQQPCTNVSVTLLHPALGCALRSVQTDQQGAYALYSIPAGAFVLAARDLSSSNALATAVVRPMTFADQEAVALNLHLAEPARRIVGHLWSVEESLPLAADVLVLDSAGTLLARTTADPVGAFTVGLPEVDAVRIVVRAPGFRPSLTEAASPAGVTSIELPVEMLWAGVQPSVAPASPQANQALIARLRPGSRPAPHVAGVIISLVLRNIDVAAVLGDAAEFADMVRQQVQRLLEELFAEPTEDVDSTLWPPSIKEKINGCPTAKHWFDRYQHQLDVCTLALDGWQEEYDASIIDNRANLGLFSINLLKLLGSIAQVFDSSGKLAAGVFIEGIPDILKKIMNRFSEKESSLALKAYLAGEAVVKKASLALLGNKRATLENLYDSIAKSGLDPVEMKKQLDKIRQELLDLEYQIDDVTDAIASLEARVAELETKIADFVAEIDKLQARKDLFHHLGDAFTHLKNAVSADVGTPPAVQWISSTGSGIIQGLPALTQNFWTVWNEAWQSLDFENVLGFIGNLTGFLDTVQTFAELSGKKEIFGKAGKYLDLISNAASVLVEAKIGITTGLAHFQNLMDARKRYAGAVRLRDEFRGKILEALADCRDEEDDDEGDDEECPPGFICDGDGDDGDTIKPRPAASSDPNDKTTVGHGNAGFVPPGTLLAYTIRFENVATANAPAQEVTITDPLPPELDWTTLELTGVGFNHVELDIPAGQTELNAVARVATDPNPVGVRAAFDANTGVIQWHLESVDPLTGNLPEDPFHGFLPPNTTNQIGEGYVSYLIRTRADLPHGTAFTNGARIVFDVNAPIDTPPALNTIDASAPASLITAETTDSSLRNYRLSWTGSDGITGSGLANYTVYASVDGGSWEAWLGPTTAAEAPFQGQCGHSYAFYSVARDAAGNLEPPPSVPDVILHLPANTPPLLDAIPDTTAHVGRLLLITNRVVHPDLDQAVAFSLAPGTPPRMTIDPLTGVLRWRPDCGDGGAEFPVTVRATDDGCGLLASARSFRIRVTECLQVDPGDAAGMPGDSVCVPVDLISGLSLTNLTFVVQVPPDRFTNITIHAAAPEVGEAHIDSVTSTQIVARVWAKPGASLRGPLTLAHLCVTLLGGQGSAFVPVEIADVIGHTLDGTEVPSTAASTGTVRVVEDEPLLEIELGSSASVILLVYSRPGTMHHLWQTSDPASGPWTALQTLVSNQLVERLSLPVEPGAARFYRLRRSGAD